MRVRALGCCLGLLFTHAAAALSSGHYGETLRLAVDPDSRQLSADLNWPSTDGSSGCRLYLYGEPDHQDQYRISATAQATSSVHQGQLQVLSNGSAVRLRLQTVPAACATIADRLRQGVLLPQTSVQPWRGIRWVAAAKAYFHHEPDASTRRKAYVVTHDAIAYQSETAAFVEAEYLKPGSTTRGWIS